MSSSSPAKKVSLPKRLKLEYFRKAIPKQRAISMDYAHHRKKNRFLDDSHAAPTPTTTHKRKMKSSPITPDHIPQLSVVNSPCGVDMDSAIFHAHHHGDFSSIRALVLEGDDINHICHKANGVTALICATIRGDVNMVSFLLQHGGTLQIKDQDHKTAFDHAQDIRDCIVKRHVLEVLALYEEEDVEELTQLFDFHSIGGQRGSDDDDDENEDDEEEEWSYGDPDAEEEEEEDWCTPKRNVYFD